MITWSDFVSSYEKDGEKYMIERAYYPYGEEMPNESLIAFFGAVFRVNWATKTVTVPKDDNEYIAWRRESMALSEKDYGTDYVAKVDASCDAFSVSEVMYMNSSGWGAFGIILKTEEAVKNAHHGRDTQPVVTVNGVTLTNETNYIQTPNDFNGGSRNGGRENGFWLDAPAFRTLPDAFEITVSWRGGSVSFTVDKADFTATPLDWDTYKGIMNL